MLLSILGLYNYDNSIFEDLNVPEGIEKESVINNILLNCAELEIIYSQFDTMKLAIKTWSDSNQLIWEKLYKTMTVEYNPIWNVDADITDRETINGGRSIGRTGEEEEIKSVKGFNETSWAESEKYNRNGSEDINEESETVREYTQRRTGNIGVTATQELIQKEREVATFNMIEFITDSFKKRFCIMIY